MSETDLTKGREMRRKLLGDAYVDNIAATTYKDPLMQKFLDLASETVFGRCGRGQGSISRRAR